MYSTENLEIMGKKDTIRCSRFTIAAFFSSSCLQYAISLSALENEKKSLKRVYVDIIAHNGIALTSNM